MESYNTSVNANLRLDLSLIQIKHDFVNANSLHRQPSGIRILMRDTTTLTTQTIAILRRGHFQRIEILININGCVQTPSHKIKEVKS